MVMIPTPERSSIFEEIEVERGRQDARWGGPEHDSGHSWKDWVQLITHHANRTMPTAQFRRQMIKVAALAVAGIEAFDRMVGK